MNLLDHQILHAQTQGHIDISPFDPDCVEPASYDVHLGDMVLTYRTPRREYPANEACLDLRKDCTGLMESTLLPMKGWELPPGYFALATTLECIRFGNNFSGRVEGKSSIGRCGLIVHVTAGYLDPGFHGQITLELLNVLSDYSIKIYPGMKIAQISFMKHDSFCERPYGHPGRKSKYQNQSGPAASRIHENF